MKTIRPKHLALATLIILNLQKMQAQQPAQKPSHFGFGIQLNQFQKDFGAGINLTSPYFAKQKVAIRLRGNIMFNEHIKNNLTEWTPYSNALAGVKVVTGHISENIRCYAEGGVALLFPSSNFSTKNYNPGGYGLFGFEFWLNKHGLYFIELGGIGTGAIADKADQKPIYSNGFTIATGFRIQL